ncbi:hypothetical protein [Streptomyces scabiei]|uniref:hypothetical protein n=1 Tax=Streptomyces scabiei TaxID=1930 RepID=UPI0007660656|nr:hypothetical protein [Streptomyces scabiei]
MSDVDQHAEAHRLRDEDGYGARRIATELGISRHAATVLLARPLPQPVAEVAEPVAAEEPPVAEPVAEVAESEPVPADEAAGVADEWLPVAEPVAEVADLRRPVAALRVEGVVWFPRPGGRSPWLEADLSGRPWLLRDLMRLARVGLRIPYIVDLAVRSFAAAYWEAVTGGHLAPGQPYEIHTRVRPRRAA